MRILAISDVPGWAREYVDRVTELGLVDGRSGTPAAYLTYPLKGGITVTDSRGLSPHSARRRRRLRLAFVTALYRLAKTPDVKDVDNPFTDVKEEDPYRDAVVWAHTQKIVEGRGEGR